MNRRMTRPLSLLLGLVCLCMLVVWEGPPYPEGQSVVVTRRDGDVRIATNGDIQVRETWQVRFAGGPFHFAFRPIPLDRVESISGWGVSESGQAYREASGEQPGTFQLENTNSQSKITWYFAPTSDASRTFVLAYTLHGALRIYPAGDQFFWKFVEADRQYSIEASQVTVTLPASFASNTLLTQTYLNTTEAGPGQIVDGQTVAFTGGPFAGGTTWEIRVQFPHGVVSAAPPAWQARDDRVRATQPIYNLVSLVLALVILTGGGLGLYLLWYTRGRDRATGIVAEFYPRPPEPIPPGMAGTLLDERADMKDILATLVDLARRGYLRIVEIGTDGRAKGAAGFRFVRLRGDDGKLRPYERLLFDRVFGQHSERDLEDLKNKFYSSLPDLRARLYDEAVAVGDFARNPRATRLLYTLGGIALAVIAGGVGFAGYALIAGYAPLAILVVIALVIVGVGLVIAGQFMPRKTPQGATAAAQWRAFKRYLQQIGRYTTVAEAQAQFDAYLPYAIAFGVEQKWVHAFEKVNTPVPVWYQPYGYPTYYGHGHHGRFHDARGGNGSPGGGGSQAPGLDSMAGQTFGGLNAMSAGFFSMLNTASSTFTSSPQSSGSGGFSG